MSSGINLRRLAKSNIGDLAIFGGTPLFGAPLHVGKPNIPNRKRLAERFDDILDRRWLTNNGPYVVEFEKRVREIAGSKHCVAVCNATIGLQLLIRALRWKGDVIVPSFTFVATAHALMWEGVTPVFADIAERGYCLDPRAVEARITPRTTGILPVHVFGEICDVDALDWIARQHNLTVAYDAAHAFGCGTGTKSVGGLGEASVFSFHATKFLNCSEGGAIVTDNDGLAEQLRLMRNFGFTGEDKVEGLGINAKMPEMSAAMGLTSLEGMNDVIAVNRAHYEEYRVGLSGLGALTLSSHKDRESGNDQYVVLEVGPEAGISRNAMYAILHAEGAYVRRYFYPGCHRSEPYRSLDPDAGQHLPRTEVAANRVLCLPSGTGIGPDEIAQICNLFRLMCANADSIRARMKDVSERDA